MSSLSGKSNIKYRPSTEADAEAVAQVLVPYVEARQLLRRDVGELMRLAEGGFVAEFEGCVIGFAAVEVYSQRLAEVQSLAVDLRFQRQGVGRELVRLCVEYAREKNVRELMAITASEDFLLDCGFDYSLPNQKRALFLRTNDEEC